MQLDKARGSHAVSDNGSYVNLASEGSAMRPRKARAAQARLAKMAGGGVPARRGGSPGGGPGSSMQPRAILSQSSLLRPSVSQLADSLDTMAHAQRVASLDSPRAGLSMPSASGVGHAPRGQEATQGGLQGYLGQVQPGAQSAGKPWRSLVWEPWYVRVGRWARRLTREVR